MPHLALWLSASFILADQGRWWKKSRTSWYREYPVLYCFICCINIVSCFHVVSCLLIGLSSNNTFATWWNSFGCRISCSWLRRTADVAPGSGFLWYKGLLLRLLFRIRHRMTSVFGEAGKTWLNCVLHDTSEHSRNRNCSTFKILEMAMGTCLVRCQRIIQKNGGCEQMECGRHAHQNSVHQEGCGHVFNWSQAPLYRPAIEPWMQRSGKLWQFGARNCLLLFAHVFWWTPSGLIWSNFFRLKKLLDNPCFKCLILLPLPLGCMLCCKPISSTILLPKVPKAWNIKEELFQSLS